MKQPASIFNDVLGPVMIGPSSSHTAASVRIGYMLRQICGGQPQKAVFYFSHRGSLASCHEGQGTDMGLAAGLLGLPMDDGRIAQSMALARQAGISIEFVLTDEPVDHPNLYDVEITGGGKSLRAEFISTGGGMIHLRRLNGIDVDIDGGSHVTLPIAGEDIVLTPVLPIQSLGEYSGLFNTAAEVLALTQAKGWQLWQAACLYESRRGAISEDEVFAKMGGLLGVMRRAISKARQQPYFADRILPPQAHFLDNFGGFPNPALNGVIQSITLLMEAKSALIPIVAAPTAGSCGALPGSVIGAAEAMGLGEEDMTKALLVAGMVGILIAEHATFAAEIGGCQAECGAGSGMAAAALVQLLGGSAKQALDAASMALQNIFGLVCDPVAARVEVPCLGRNIMAGTNAMAMAQLAMAGFDAVLPLDEVIAAMHEVGQSIDSSLRCTCGAGLSLTKTSREIEGRLQENTCKM